MNRDNRDELYDMLTELMEEKLCDFKSEAIAEISEAFTEIVSETVAECLSNIEMHLPDGTMVTPRKKLKLLSPEKDKLIVCYGGLRVDKGKWNGAPDGWLLWVQTRISSWDIIATYHEKNDAIAALEKVKSAMENGIEILEL